MIKNQKEISFLTILSILMLCFYTCTLTNQPIQENLIDLHENDMNLRYSKGLNVEISGSIIENPIFINGTASGIAAQNWTWAEAQDWCSGSGTSNNPYIIENLLINGNNLSNCIEIHNSDKFIIIRDCTVLNSSLSESDPGAGIFLKNVSNSKLIDNECDYNAYGIFMEQCTFNNITGNSASFNRWAGFHLNLCENITISNNIANNNVGVVYESVGIYLNLCNFNEVYENTANYNTYGIRLSGLVSIWGSHNNTIRNNKVSYNDIGIYLYGDFGRSYDNNISGNIVSNNLEYGIRVSRSPQNIFCNNLVRDNDNIGISVWKESHNNTFTENIILNNNGVGLKIDYDCYWNLVYYNCFVGNAINAQDERTDNEWDNGVYGNYWDDYNGIDANDDNIGDNPYDVPPTGSSVDNFPLMTCPFSIPSVGGGFPIELIILIASISGGVVIVIAAILFIRIKRK
ncbi:MAG: right-handed parallel beta-helix repeat-containing protein [Promethearchaeota archaeon]|nr:MAG: right-handed parallel beta-helix repeat-containing protein [Candidatus Lokiarchaeota archaeon]